MASSLVNFRAHYKIVGLYLYFYTFHPSIFDRIAFSIPAFSVARQDGIQNDRRFSGRALNSFLLLAHSLTHLAYYITGSSWALLQSSPRLRAALARTLLCLTVKSKQYRLCSPGESNKRYGQRTTARLLVVFGSYNRSYSIVGHY